MHAARSGETRKSGSSVRQSLQSLAASSRSRGRLHTVHAPLRTGTPKRFKWRPGFCAEGYLPERLIPVSASARRGAFTISPRCKPLRQTLTLETPQDGDKIYSDAQSEPWETPLVRSQLGTREKICRFARACALGP